MDTSGQREARKVVTLLFCDMTGSTTLGDRLDAESFRHVMTRYHEAMRTVLESHGGTVEKFIGDAIMAVFGAPTTHEDDALRAVRAAADMQLTLVSLNGELDRDWGLTIDVRIGLNTGEVVAGESSLGHPLVTGDAVNVAARLEQAASPGEILVGEATYSLVKEAVEAEEVFLDLKGKANAVRAFRVLRAPPAEPSPRRLRSVLVDREGEMELLRQALDRAVNERVCHLFTVLGAAGVGKSRLVAELARQAERRVRLVRGRCLPYGQGITFWAAQEIVRQISAIAVTDAPDVARSKLIASLLGAERSELIGDRIGRLIGPSQTDVPNEETFWAIRKFLDAVAADRPLMVVVEDIHWAEPTFLDLIEHIAEWSRDAPILLVCLARTELLDSRRHWGGGKLNATTIHLEPLSDAECGELIENLMGAGSLEEHSRSLIAQAAEGNPLFVEETLSMMIDAGLLTQAGDRWDPVGDLSKLSVPPSIQALLAARLDQLGPEERVVIERASVVGRVFSIDAVRALVADDPPIAVEAALRTLLRKELVRPESAQRLGEDLFRFRHHLIRDAAYQGMVKQVRAEMHQRAAEWLGAFERSMDTEHDGLIGYHLEQAHRYRLELGPATEEVRALGARAAARLASAGRRAFGREDMPAAVNLLTRATSLMPSGPERLELLPDLAAALTETAEFAAAEGYVDEAIGESIQTDNARVRAHAMLARLLLLLQTRPEEWSKQGMTEAQNAVRIFEEVNDQRGLAKAWRVIGELDWTRCRFARAEESFNTSIDYSRSAGDERQEAWCLYALAAAAAWGPTPVPEGIRRCEQIIARTGAHRIVEARGVLALAALTAMQGQFDEARALTAKGRSILGDVGLKIWTAGSCQTSAYVEMLASDAEAAERELRAGYATLDEMGERGYLPTVAAELAQALYAQGRYVECERFTRAAEEIGSPDDLATQVEWRGPRAKVLARQGNVDLAVSLADDAVSIAAATDYLNLHADALMDLAEVHALAGNREEASRRTSAALGLYERKGNVASAHRVRDAMARLGVVSARGEPQR